MVSCAWLLAGCGALRGPGAEPAAAAPAPPVLRLVVQAPEPLAALLQQHLDLARVNRLAAGEPLQEGELDRLVAAAPEQVRALLDTEGYFNAEIEVVQTAAGNGTGTGTGTAAEAGTETATGTGTATEIAPSPGAAALPTVRVAVRPGPRTLVGAVDIAYDGPITGSSDDPRAARLRQTLREDWPLPPGRPFRDADWTRAKTATVAALRAQGYVQAEWASTQARVDAATQRAALAGTLQSGPLFRVGPLQVQGLQRQDEQTVRNIADLKPGEPATESLLLDMQERLQLSDLFNRTTVTLAADTAQPAATPVVATLTERELQEATFGIGFGANVGARATVDHVHRRPFGRPWRARNRLDIAQVQQRWDGELSTQTLPGLYRNLVGGGVERVESDTDVVTSSRLRVGRAKDTRRIDRQLFLEFQRSTTSNALGRSKADALALHFQGVWRKLDDIVLPTRGRAWTGQFALGAARSNPGEQGPFGRVYARLDAYRPLGETWFGQGRIELGQVLARDDVQVPEALRFRAGGDESVRGYAYRSLTSRVNGVDVGGKVLFTASAEAARPLLDRIPQLWGAVFVDVGRAALRWGDLNPAWGAGVGLRYRSPVGPVKLDLAWGEEERRLRLHLSVGLAF